MPLTTDKEEDLLLQQSNTLTSMIALLTKRALDATKAAGEAEGYSRRLKEELERQLAVQSAMVARVAWYENITRIVVGGQISADAYNDGPHATGIRCERCHRQVEEVHIVKHLINHAEEDAKEAEIKRAVEQARYDKRTAEMQASAKPKPKRRK